MVLDDIYIITDLTFQYVVHISRDRADDDDVLMMMVIILDLYFVCSLINFVSVKILVLFFFFSLLFFLILLWICMSIFFPFTFHGFTLGF